MAGTYRSSIPISASERVVANYPNGEKHTAEYLLNGEVVGERHFYETGKLEFEYAFKNGAQHGMQYRWMGSGQLLSAAPYVKGVPHGAARQWADDGTLIGTCTLHHGTGIDLWCESWPGGFAHLAEVHYMQDGRPHGLEWWLNKDEASVHEERHWVNGAKHGIERAWNARGRLRRGYPRYNVHGTRVTKARYGTECGADVTLPPFREEENEPGRIVPEEIRKYLRNSSI